MYVLSLVMYSLLVLVVDLYIPCLIPIQTVQLKEGRSFDMTSGPAYWELLVRSRLVVNIYISFVDFLCFINVQNMYYVLH